MWEMMPFPEMSKTGRSKEIRVWFGKYEVRQVCTKDTQGEVPREKMGIRIGLRDKT